MEALNALLKLLLIVAKILLFGAAIGGVLFGVWNYVVPLLFHVSALSFVTAFVIGCVLAIVGMLYHSNR